MKINIELEQNDLDQIRDMLEDWMGISLTDDQILVLMKSENDILLEMAKYGISDTPTRESLMRAVGERIVGKEYPSLGMGEDYREQFWKELVQKAKEAGIKVLEERTAN